MSLQVINVLFIQFTVTLNNKKDKSGDTIEVVIVGRPASYVGLSALDKTLFDMKGGSEFGHAEVCSMNIKCLAIEKIPLSINLQY